MLADAADMAKQTTERLTDDLDGSQATETVSFGIDGISLSIDVNDQHANELRSKLAPYIQVARRVRTATRGPAGGRSLAVATKERNAHIRGWALSEGAELPSRGRIASAVRDAYEAKDGDALREALGLELVEEAKPKRRRRGGSAADVAAE